jgi:hypothetical protein
LYNSRNEWSLTNLQNNKYNGTPPNILPNPDAQDEQNKYDKLQKWIFEYHLNLFKRNDLKNYNNLSDSSSPDNPADPK